MLMRDEDYAKLLEDTEHELLAGRGPVGVLGLTPVTLRLLASLTACGLTGAVEAVYAPAADDSRLPLTVPVRSFPALREATCGAHDQDGRPYRSFQGLLAHLATLTRNELRFAGTPAAVPVLAEPTSEQRQAFELIGAAIPLTLRK